MHVLASGNSSYPLLNAFWTMLWFFLWILWFFLLFRILIDIFRSSDLSGWGKAGWTVLIIIFPFLGGFIYLIVRGGSRQTRDAREAQAADAAMRSYIRETATAPASSADELAKLAQLRD